LTVAHRSFSAVFLNSLFLDRFPMAGWGLSRIDNRIDKPKE
jgi:hypothetical protein